MFKLSQRYTLVHIAYLYSINDVAYVVNQSKLSAYANDTQIYHADKDPVKVQEIINDQGRINVARGPWHMPHLPRG